jgi:hypothetical protein
MRLYRKASWEEGGSEVAAAVALRSMGTGALSGSPVREDTGGTIGVWDDLFVNRDGSHGMSGGSARGLFSSTTREPERDRLLIGRRDRTQS